MLLFICITSLFFSVVYVFLNINENGVYDGESIINDIFHSSIMALIIMIIILLPFKELKK